MKRLLQALLSLGAFAAILGSSAQGASAAEVFIRADVPVYTTWQPAWDRYEFDRRHVILGSVTSFQPYRLQIARRNGNVQNVDLKPGTIILPTGSTPTPGMRVALVGYYSHGTFIVNRLMIR